MEQMERGGKVEWTEPVQSMSRGRTFPINPAGSPFAHEDSGVDTMPLCPL